MLNKQSKMHFNQLSLLPLEEFKSCLRVLNIATCEKREHLVQLKKNECFYYSQSSPYQQRTETNGTKGSGGSTLERFECRVGRHANSR